MSQQDPIAPSVFAALGTDDSIVMHSGTRHAFTCGPEGLEFITIRTGEATIE